MLALHHEQRTLTHVFAVWRTACTYLKGQQRQTRWMLSWLRDSSKAVLARAQSRVAELEAKVQDEKMRRLMVEVSSNNECEPPTPSRNFRGSTLMAPPCCNWPLQRTYACFLSHYKLEAASDARYLKDLLQRMMGAPVFLDSEDLVDLRDLFEKGVRCSDVLVVLCTTSIALRPWCLCEILEATRAGVPVIPVILEGKGFSSDLLKEQLENLESRLEKVPGLREVEDYLLQAEATFAELVS